MALRPTLLIGLTILGLSSIASAQPTLNTSDKGTDKTQPDALVDASGPWGGLVFDVVYGPGPSGFDAYALTQAGIYRFDAANGRWRHEVLLPLAGPQPTPPYAVDMVHLVDGTRAHAGFHNPEGVTLMVTERQFIVLSSNGQLHRAPRAGAWIADLLPEETAFGPGKKVPMVVTAALGRRDTEQLFVLRSDRAAEGGLEKSRLWDKDGASRTWGSQDWAGRAVLVRTGGAVGPAWRWSGLSPRTSAGFAVDRFLRPRWTKSDSIRLQEIEWAKLLKASSASVQGRCGGATGMLEVTTGAGYDEPPVIVALGPRSLCVSADGGTSFTVRDGLFETRNPRERIGDLISAVAFARAKSAAGVRLLVGTDEVFNPEAPSGRAFGGRLFMSDDAGVSWQDVTPDIDGSGGFISLAAGPRAEGRKVWLLTARRGLYLSTEGLGFSRSSAGVSAMPIHALAADPIHSDKVWAATPTGLHRYEGRQWARQKMVSTRSLGVWSANEVQKGQLWSGTYRGSVLIRGDVGGLRDERLPTGGGRLELTTSVGALDRPVPLEAGVRPVVLVVPVGLDAQRRDRGYAVERDGGFYIRAPAPADFVEGPDMRAAEDGMVWRRLETPMSSPVNIQAMVPARLDGREMGALVFVTESSEGSVRGVAWLHDPRSGWSRAELPGGTLVKDAVYTPERVWISTLEGRLIPVETAGSKVKFGAAIVGEHFCDRLELRLDETLACVATPLLGGQTRAGVKALRALARATVIPLSSLSPGARLGPGVSRWLYEASNPLGRAFAPPDAVTFSHINDVGEHAWISPGLGVYTRAVALDGVLPMEGPDEGPGPALWVAPVVAGLVFVALGVWFFWVRRRRARR